MSIRVCHVTKEFPGSDGVKTVLKDFSCEFPEGQVTCLMGESGSGKTTLVNLMLGLLSPDSGSISGLPLPISAVFQENRLCEEFSAVVNVRLATGKSDREILVCGEELGLSAEQMRQPVRTLSGGMRRRVAVARALLFDADCYLFDEPFKGCDRDTRQRVIDCLLRRTRGKTVVVVTHDPEEPVLLGAQVIVLQDE